jgi:DNA-binding transcriptional ArsR family regulator
MKTTKSTKTKFELRSDEDRYFDFDTQYIARERLDKFTDAYNEKFTPQQQKHRIKGNIFGTVMNYVEYYIDACYGGYLHGRAYETSVNQLLANIFSSESTIRRHYKRIKELGLLTEQSQPLPADKDEPFMLELAHWLTDDLLEEVQAIQKEEGI